MNTLTASWKVTTMTTYIIFRWMSLPTVAEAAEPITKTHWETITQ
jgi:hypothetical protein